MKTDSFNNPAKTAYRRDCIAFLREHAGNILLDSETKKLRGQWCELAGESGYLSLEELEQAGILGDEQFIGVDTSRENIRKNRAQHPRATWVCADMHTEIHNEDHKISVFNLDGYRETNSRPGSQELSWLHTAVTKAVRRFGACVVFYNTDLSATRYRKQKASVALLAHTQAVCQQLSGWLPGRVLLPEVILSEDLALQADGNYTGPLGEYYYIYRGNTHRMANLKLVFR